MVAEPQYYEFDNIIQFVTYELSTGPNEAIENSFSAVENFSQAHRNEQDNICWEELGKIKENLNPLDMLRLLSTNPLYHVSKALGLHGGGYPIRRMSLSGLTALEEAYYSLPIREERALVLGTVRGFYSRKVVIPACL